jgi:two-component system response regulator AtoC
LLLQAEVAGPRLQYATLEGEPGTGKHLFAQTIHRSSALATMPFQRRDAREWLASEAEAASLVGTLYLDRVDLLSSAAQNLLLDLVKVLQNQEFQRTNPQKSAAARLSRFLLLVSTHTSLRQLAGQGQFLPDLAFRLSAVRFPLPPLREHREDIAPLAQTLIDRICRRYQQPTAVLSPGTLPKLLQHTWPGNVRELASVLETAILDSTTGVLRPSDFVLSPANVPPAPAAVQSPSVAAPTTSSQSVPDHAADMTLDAVIQRHIHLILNLNRGNKLRAARQLGISRSTLYRILAGGSIAEANGGAKTPGA